MKKYNHIIMLSVIVYAVLAVGVALFLHKGREQNGQFYKVEINRIMDKLQNRDEKEEALDLTAYTQVKFLEYMSATETDQAILYNFYHGRNGLENVIMPYFKNDKIEGYVRFDYKENISNEATLLGIEVALLLLEIFLLVVLWYLKSHLITPFHSMQDMTYELSKGNLQEGIKAEKNQYLGRFLWGMNQLKDALSVSKKRELELQKEKKMLLLSLSHDIKTPLNTIKLYSKALGEGVYTSYEETTRVYGQIEEKATEIEKYVREIVKASREDIVDIQIEQGEFYLADMIRKISLVYGEKCALRKCELQIGEYSNRLFTGDFYRLFEVFENLFENAFKYGDGRKIELSFYEEDYCQLIRVFNTGELVGENDFVHMFDSFFRGDNTGGKQGNGLGLYICKEIMHKMGGEIFAERESEGMAFVVVLPM